MKKIFFAALMAVAALTASAQEAGTFSLEPHASLGYAPFDESTWGFDGFVTGAVGGEATYMLTNVFGVSAGIDYVYGQTIEEEDASINFSEGNFKLNYQGKSYLTHEAIAVPVLAQVHFGKFAIKAGVQFNFMLSGKIHYEGDGKVAGVKITSSGTESYKNEDFCNKNQISIPVGLCYTLRSIPLQFDLRYNIPATKYFETDDESRSLSTILLSVGYRFDLNK